MAQFSQQNPISIRVDLMRKKWVEKVKDSKINFIRWIVQPDELRMVDAFCLLEGSVHGQLADLFVRAANHLTDINTFDRVLIEEWISGWESPEGKKQIAESGVKVKWDVNIWKRKLATEGPCSFLEFMSDFAESMEGFNDFLVVYVVPITYVTEEAWVQWVTDKIQKGVPPRIRLMISDIAENQLFEKFRKINNTAHILADLNMHKAAREIATSGDPQSPGVQFNTCLFNLNDALAKKNLADVNYWGNKAIETAKKNKIFNLEVAGGIAYGASLYQLEKFPLAIEKYRVARETAKAGLEAGDNGCGPVFIQSYAFEAAVHLRKKDYKQALAVYQEMGTLAMGQKNYVMAADGWYMASYAAQKLGKKEDAFNCLQNGFKATLMLAPEHIKYSSLLLIGENLYTESNARKDKALAETINWELTKHWGENWRELASEHKKNQKDYGKGGFFLNFDFLKFKN
jgi:tetratricopeptide (TPR) repeat protein